MGAHARFPATAVQDSRLPLPGALLSRKARRCSSKVTGAER